MNETGYVGPKMYQTAVISFSDGTKGYFFGAAVMHPGDKPRSVTGVQLTIPRPLPPGYVISTSENL